MSSADSLKAANLILPLRGSAAHPLKKEGTPPFSKRGVGGISASSSLLNQAGADLSDATEAQKYRWSDSLSRCLLALHPQTPDALRHQLQALIRQLAQALAQGHTCLPLTQCPQHAMIVGAAQAEHQPAPLVFDQDALYFWRQWQQERVLAQHLARLIRPRPQLPSLSVTVAENEVSEPLQRAAIELAAQQPFSLITGGPGTGKTFTLVRIVRILQQANSQIKSQLRIALAAPTGKAAQRMQSVLAEEFARLQLPTEQMQSAQTVHRLLGLGGRATPKYHRGQPLPFDLVVIDEGSMLDLALASQLFDAIGDSTRVIILGDADQLAAVDAGAVLADLYRSAALEDHRCHLQVSRRFDPKQGIGQLAHRVLNGQLRDLAQVLTQNSEVRHIVPQVSAREAAYAQLWSGFMPYVAALQQQQPVAQLFAAFEHYRVLAAQRSGYFGTEQVNRALSACLQQALALTVSKTQHWYHGRPVMMTRNDYGLRLSNGDIGLCLADEHGHYALYFSHLSQPIAVSRVAVEQFETAFALTIHKSQGSEFSHVAMLLEGAVHGLLSRELVYTAITRAKNRLDVYASVDTLKQAVQQKNQRTTGLDWQIKRAVADWAKPSHQP